MAFFHRYAEHGTVDPVESQHIRRIQIHLFNAVPTGKILRGIRQLKDLSTDGDFIADSVHLIALHIVILPCRLCQLHGGQMFLLLQKSDIHNISFLKLFQRHCLSVFIRKVRGSIHGQRISFPQIQVQETDSFVNTVDIYQHGCICRIKTVRVRHNKARVHPFRIGRCRRCLSILHRRCRSRRRRLSAPCQ